MGSGSIVGMVTLLLGLVLGLALGVLVGGYLVRATGARDEQRARDSFAALSQQALSQAGAQFLDLASATLGRHHAVSAGDLELRKQAVDAVVGPLRQQLDAVNHALGQLEANRQGAYAGLTEQVRGLADAQQQLRVETSALTTALKAPAVRGRWGELQLRRVVELAGMVERCDFDEQPHSAHEDGILRPDMVIRMPGNGSIVVDSKVPLEAFLMVGGAPDEATRRQALQHHARQLGKHVETLAAKAYWQRFQPAPELVVLFVPGDQILSAALESDPELYERAIRSSVLLAGPTSLIGLLRTIAYGWRQEALADGARQVCDLGRELHQRLSTLAGHVDQVGRSLDKAVDHYNAAVGTLETRVLVSARKFSELSVTDADLTSPRQVDKAARHIAGDQRGGGTIAAADSAA
ncbi:MAG: recombination protein RmuC [Frankiales bacterium]|nr:recombination protein RmuC [Frankiales bacterium]